MIQMDNPFSNPFENITPIILVGVVIGGVGAEFVHPHAYGLHLFPSTFITMKNGKRFHIHHWVWGVLGLGAYSLKPFSNTFWNSLTVGTFLGIIGQGVSYSTSHMMLYDSETFHALRSD
jgi:hypothetical protein